MICLDMDGVLADFSSAANLIHNRPGYEVTHWEYYQDWGMTPDEFWAPLRAYGIDKMYEKLIHPYPWLNELMGYITAADDFIIVTAPARCPESYAGKRIWVDKHLPGAKLAVMSEKHLMSRFGNLLIDDNDVNVSRFEDGEGDAFRFPQPWNEASVFVSNRMVYIQEELADWSCGIGRS